MFFDKKLQTRDINFNVALYIAIDEPAQRSHGLNEDSVDIAIDIPSLPPLDHSTEKYNLLPSVRNELRDYQWELALPGLSGQNYIVCAPTGSGKTRVAGLVISEHLKRKKGLAKVIFVVNKVPLVHQQRTALQDMIQGAKVEEVVGDGPLHKKAVLAAYLAVSSSDECSDSEKDEDKQFHVCENDIIVCTAGCLKNGILSGNVSLSTISLLIIDECHNTRKKSNYAKIMQEYIKEKVSQKKLPQVIGLTATPGAGDSARPTLDTVLDHMISLCAAMDAQGGIKTVAKNKLELDSFQKSPIHTQCVLEGRREDEPFIATITQIMTKLEETYKLRSPTRTKWKQDYVGWVNSELHKYQEMSTKRDTISVLKTLKCFSDTLCTYYNLRYDDALCVLQNFLLPHGKEATKNELQLSKLVQSLQDKLASLEIVKNPLLVRLETVLVKQFECVPESKAIIFVETKKQATSVCNWLTSTPMLHRIRPDVVTGQTRDSGKKMTITEQNAALEEFRGEHINLLVSTSVLEEGIDVPACNLVIKYQKVSNEIAEIQSKGRARSSHSQSFTIVSSDSGKQYHELLNEDKNLLVEQVLEMFPTGELLSRMLPSKHENILKQLEYQKMHVEQKKQLYPSYEVEVQCSHCSAFLCNASDIHTIPNTRHYVVTAQDFSTKEALVKEHPNPCHRSYDLSRTHKLYCSNCSVQDLGVMGKWWKHQQAYPVIKCVGIKFIAREKTIICKKWKDAPFEVTPMKSI